MLRPKSATRKAAYLIIATIFVPALTIFGVLPRAAASGSAQLYISPSNLSGTAGSNVTFTVMVNAGSSTVNGVQTTISYSSSIFSYVSFTPSSAFSVAGNGLTGVTTSSGSVNIGLGANPAVTGTQTVGTLVLQANTSGSGSISFSSICTGTTDSTCSAVTDSTTNGNDLATITSGSYTIASSGSAPVVTLTASPTATSSGFNSTLTWTSTNATSCSAVSPANWTASTATSGSKAVASAVSSKTASTYTISCTGTGGTTQASATVTVDKPGDCNGDNKVNITDLTLLGYYWNESNPVLAHCDLNGDNKINVTDLTLIGYYWGT